MPDPSEGRLGDVIKLSLIDRYGLADAVVERNEEMGVKMIVGLRQAETFLTRLSGLARNEYAVLYAAANNADLIDVNALLCRPTPPGRSAGCCRS